MFENKRARYYSWLPARKVMMESLSVFIEGIVLSDDPKAMFEEYADEFPELFELRSSIKHMRNVDMSFCNP